MLKWATIGRGPVLTLPRLNRALARVVRELDSHGLWDEALAAIEVYLAPFSVTAYGWQMYSSTGEIRMPAVCLGRLRDFFRGDYMSVADVLRHEYGHALADTHRGLFRSRQFSTAFGASHECPDEFEYDPECHVSPYSAKDTSEDFAEVFMLYLRRSGRLPSRHATPAIVAKWRFVQNLCRAVRARKRRW
ncbi:MAG: hypothetical protein NTY19_08560 [Planctomycetota bacterium]|nr:hypothetical protein [Planctomycetota bacterium]